MSVSAATLRKLAALQLDPAQMAGVLELLAEQQEQEEARKAAQRERTRRSRSKRDGNVTDTSQSQGGNVEVSPKKETSPTPPKEKTTPSQSEANASSKTPRAALETVLDANRAGQVLEHRQKIRKPLTVRAAELLAAQFAECPDPNAAADLMVLNGWQGFKPEWVERQQPRGSPPRQPQPRGSDYFDMEAERLRNERAGSGRGHQGNWDDAAGVSVLTIDYHG